MTLCRSSISAKSKPVRCEHKRDTDRNVRSIVFFTLHTWSAKTEKL